MNAKPACRAPLGAILTLSPDFWGILDGAMTLQS